MASPAVRAPEMEPLRCSCAGPFTAELPTPSGDMAYCTPSDLMASAFSPLLWAFQGEVVRKTVAVKSLVEKTLSPLYSGRPVNIIGEINNQLGAAQMGSKAA